MAYDAKKNIHAGHRERLKGRFSEGGPDSLLTHQLLELLLFYAIPYKDTNPTAHALISRFGSLRGVFEAPLSELEEVPGVGRNAALMLRVSFDAAMDYLENGNNSRVSFDYTRKLGNYLLKLYEGATDEFVTLMLLDNSNSLISCKRIFDGSISSPALHPADMIEAAIMANAPSAVIAHNHPGGMPIPSSDDLDITRELSRAFAVSGIMLIDHIIIAGNDFCSLMNSHPARFLSVNKKRPVNATEKG